MLDKLANKVHQSLEYAGVSINGAQPWDIQVHDKRWFRRVLLEKNLGLGESYMDGWWDCEQIDETIYRLLLGRLEDQVKGGLRYLLHFIPGLVFNLQSKARSRIIAERHYDLDNGLFLSFLDANHQYSCGYSDETNDLDEAKRKKLYLIARKLRISKDDHLLNIGCGWGGLAYYFAEKYGCKVTAVKISREQLEHA